LDEFPRESQNLGKIREERPRTRADPHALRKPRLNLRLNRR